MASQNSRALFISVVHLLGAGAIFYHLLTGGWLTTSYRLDDPNIVNLLLAIFETSALASLVAYWIFRTRGLYRLLWALGFVQLLVGLGFGLFLLFFMLTWHPKMM